VYVPKIGPAGPSLDWGVLATWEDTGRSGSLSGARLKLAGTFRSGVDLLPAKGAVNVRVQGIGKESAEVGSGKDEYGSTVLQSAAGPIYLGPRFNETVRDATNRTYHNYPFAVSWMAHELTHRWGIDVQSRTTPDPDVLRDPDFCHLLNGLDRPR
jgi:hypothetical protein